MPCLLVVPGEVKDVQVLLTYLLVDAVLTGKIAEILSPLPYIPLSAFERARQDFVGAASTRSSSFVRFASLPYVSKSKTSAIAEASSVYVSTWLYIFRTIFGPI